MTWLLFLIAVLLFELYTELRNARRVEPPGGVFFYSWATSTRKLQNYNPTRICLFPPVETGP